MRLIAQNLRRSWICAATAAMLASSSSSPGKHLGTPFNVPASEGIGPLNKFAAHSSSGAPLTSQEANHLLSSAIAREHFLDPQRAWLGISTRHWTCHAGEKLRRPMLWTTKRACAPPLLRARGPKIPQFPDRQVCARWEIIPGAMREAPREHFYNQCDSGNSSAGRPTCRRLADREPMSMGLCQRRI